MKRLLALLMAMLVLFFMPVSFARAEEDEPTETPPASETSEGEAPEQIPPAADEQTPTAAEEETEGAQSDAGTDALEEPSQNSAPEDGDPSDEPLSNDEGASGEEPSDDGDPSDETPAEDGETEPAEPPHDQPQWLKSLECWERERADIPLTGDIREDILTIARSQLGYSADWTCYEEDEAGNKGFYTRYGAWDGATFGEWCDSFVSFCVYYAGFTNYPTESSCGRHMFALKRAGYWREWNSYIPRQGDIVFFSFPSQYPMPSHVALVEEVIWGDGNEPSRLVTIEGNMSNPDGSTACVRRMVRLLSDVMGYGTYEAGKVYPQGYSYRTDGFQTIDPDSPYFLEYPVEEVLRFLGLEHTEYYAYWFPDGPAAEPAEELPPEPTGPAEIPLPETKPRRSERKGLSLEREHLQ